MCCAQVFFSKNFEGRGSRCSFFSLFASFLLVEVARAFALSFALPIVASPRTKLAEPRSHIKRFARKNADAWRQQGLFGPAAFAAAGIVALRRRRRRRRTRFLIVISRPLCRRRARCPREYSFFLSRCPALRIEKPELSFATWSFRRFSVG